MKGKNFSRFLERIIITRERNIFSILRGSILNHKLININIQYYSFERIIAKGRGNTCILDPLSKLANII